MTHSPKSPTFILLLFIFMMISLPSFSQEGHIYTSWGYALSGYDAVAYFTQNVKAPKTHVYFQHDNDVLRLVKVTDQYYSFGILTGYSRLLDPSRGMGKTYSSLIKK